MRNHKKFLAVLVIVVMIVTTMIPAFAATTDTSAATSLQSLGLVTGSNGSLMLWNACSREQGIIILVRLLGEQSDALAMSPSTALTQLSTYFSDSGTISPWAVQYVAWAVQNGYFVGDPAAQGSITTAGSNQRIANAQKTLTGNELCELILRGAGYTVNNSSNAAVQLSGLCSGIDTSLANTSLVRNDAFAIIFPALRLKVNSDTDSQTLIEFLVKSGQVDKSVATMYFSDIFTSTVSTAAMAITSAKAINGKEVEITFNQDIDPITASDELRYVFYGISGMGGDGLVADYVVTLNRRTVRAVVPTGAITTADVSPKIIINGVRSFDLSKNYTSDSTNKDAIDISLISTKQLQPQVTSVTSVGPNKFVVVFNKAVRNVGGAVETVGTATEQAISYGTTNSDITTVSGNAASYNSGYNGLSSALNPAAYIIDGRQLSALQGSANEATITNPSCDSRTFLINVRTDKSATALVPSNGANHSIAINMSGTDTTAGASSGQNTYQLVRDWSTSSNVNGGLQIGGYYSNNIALASGTSTPQVTSVGPMSRTKLRITFSQPINIATINSNISRIRWGLSTDTSSTASYLASGSAALVDLNTVDVTFPTASAMPTDKDFKVFVSQDPQNPITDLNGVAMLSEISFPMTKVTSVPVTVTATQVSGSTSQLTVTYSDTMDVTSMTTAVNYTWDGVSASSVASVSGKVVTVTVPTTTVTGSNHTLVISNVKDQFSNAIPTQTISITMTDNTAPTASVYYKSAVNLGASSSTNDVIFIKFSKPMNTDPTRKGCVTDINNYRLINNTNLPSKFNDPTVNLMNGATITAYNSGRTVRIVLPSTNSLTLVGQNAQTYTLYLGYVSNAVYYGVADSCNPLNVINSSYMTIDTGSFNSSVAITWGTNMTAAITSSQITMTLDATAITANGNGFGSIGTGDLVVTRTRSGVQTTIPVSSVALSDIDQDGINEQAVLTFPANSFQMSDTVTIALSTATANTVDMYGVSLATGTASPSSNSAPVQLYSARVGDNSTILLTFTGALQSGAAQYIANSIVVTQGTSTSTFTGYDATPAAGNIKVTGGTVDPYTYTLTLGTSNGFSIDPTRTITVKTLDQGSITLTGTNGSYLQANTNGIIASTSFAAVAAGITDSSSSGYLFDNASDVLTVTFNKALNLTPIDTAFTNLTTLSGAGSHVSKAATLTKSATNATLSIDKVGTFSGFTTATNTSQASGTVNLAYNANTRTLTIGNCATFTGNDKMALTGNTITFTPISTLKDANSNTVDTSGVPSVKC